MYQHFYHYFQNEQHSFQKQCLIVLTNTLPILVVVSYGWLLFTLFSHKDARLILSILLPLITLLSVMIIRHFIHTPRPFEKENLPPLIDHEAGNSFPSKHAASALIISLALIAYRSFFLVPMLIITLGIGISRILCGIHDMKDILGGYLLGFVIGLFFFI